jgi:dTDP-4-dehydrorhamnose 3,5-epimerase
MPFRIIETALPGVLMLEPKVHCDERGFFLESYNRKDFREATGLDIDFVQDNHSRSGLRVLRGLHYQLVRPQGKLVRVVRGAVYDVAVDVRRSSNHFGRWVGIELSEDNKRQLWIPPGFAHGYLVTQGPAEFLYKATDYWYPQHERSLPWSDPALGIEWPLEGTPVVASKDASGRLLSEAECY